MESQNGIGGRWTLVRSVLGSVWLYYFFVPVPEECAKRVRACEMQIFFERWRWGVGRDVVRRGHAWVKWELALQDFQNAELNIGGLKDLN